MTLDCLKHTAYKRIYFYLAGFWKSVLDLFMFYMKLCFHLLKKNPVQRGSPHVCQYGLYVKVARVAGYDFFQMVHFLMSHCSLIPWQYV